MKFWGFHLSWMPKQLICIMSLKIILMKLPSHLPGAYELTRWGWVMHICVSKLTTIGSDNDLSHGRRQAIIWPNAGILLIGPLGTNFSEILIEIWTFSFKKMHLKMSSGNWPFFVGLNMLNVFTLEHRETHGCVVSTVATDALVLKHQAISIHNAD